MTGPGFITIQLLNGLALAMLLFLVAAGLSLTFGLMDVLNLAHGSVFMVGAYIGLSLFKAVGNFWIAVFLVPVATAVLAYLIEFLLMRRVYQRSHLDQALLTFGVAFLAADLCQWIWGGSVQSLPAPPSLAYSVAVGELRFPAYRLFVIAFGFIAALGLWVLFERTRWGAMVRAGVSGREIARSLGIDVERMFAHTFAFGCGLAGLCGVVAAPILGVFPGLDVEVLLLSLIVVVVGGLGTLTGAFWGSLVVGVADTFGRVLLPEFSMFLIFAVMTLVLVYRPGGLLGRNEA